MRPHSFPRSALPTVLIVDNDTPLRQLMADALESHGLAVAQAHDAADALSRLEGFAYDGLVVEARLSDANGINVLEAARARYPGILAVVIGQGEVDDTVRAIKLGALDYLTKPFQLTQLAQLFCKATAPSPSCGSTMDQPQPRAAARLSAPNIIGQSAAMKQVLSAIELVSPMKSTVLIHGESGTGKELIARTIHNNSPRRHQPFVAFNAAAIPEGLIEAEIFGHVKGAFTGAVSARVGRFEAADKGTLFIDEVASMSLPFQAKLLRALQEREIERVGESRPYKFDIRLIAATNVDLRMLVKDGAFREDLFYRLNVVPVNLPPLRARRADIALLAQHFLRLSCQHNEVPLRIFSQEALTVLMDHAWPGNVRELENAVEYAVAISGRERQIGPALLPEEIRTSGRTTAPISMTIPEEGLDFTAVMSQLERNLIMSGLEKTGGNKRQAARLLNMSRTTLIDKLQRMGIPPVQRSTVLAS